MSIELNAVTGIGEVSAGDDIAGLILAALGEPLNSGDVVVVTSKIVSKSQGLTTTLDRKELLDLQTDRVVARRGQTEIVRTHHGLTLAAAGVDASNVELGKIVPLPKDPDKDARELRRNLESATGKQLAVIITDTAGRAWRIGQTDIAIGIAGIKPRLEFAGTEDSYGNVLAVTSPAIVDEIAGAADLVAEKLGGIPVVVVRGIPLEWLESEENGGAAALVRAEDDDLFGLGARDAIFAAIGVDDSSRGFPLFEGSSIEDLLTAALRGTNADEAGARVLGSGEIEVFSPRPTVGPQEWLAMGALAERLRILSRSMRISSRVVFDLGNAPG